MYISRMAGPVSGAHVFLACSSHKARQSYNFSSWGPKARTHFSLPLFPLSLPPQWNIYNLCPELSSQLLRGEGEGEEGGEDTHRHLEKEGREIL